ncbi:MAG: hypothetical protein JWQ09_5871 [Segetibacter sp.]|nr:hypothetical protein [Segetibacter sp.]
MDNASLYGVGKGDAYVIQGNPGMSALQEMQRKTALAQKQADLENAQAAAQLQKLDYNKTREADQPQFIKDYGDIQSTYNKLRTTTDPVQRIMLNNALQTQQKEFLHKASVSQMALENHKTLRQFALNHSNDIRDGYNSDLDSADKVSTFDHDYQPALDKLNANPLVTPFSQTAYEKGMLPNALTPVKDYGALKTTKLANGATMTQQENGSDVDLNKLKTQLHNDYQLNQKSGVKQYINGKVKANGTDANAEIDKYAQDIYNRSQPNYGSELITPKGHIVEPQKPARFSALEEYNLRKYGNPNSPNSALSNALTPSQVLIAGNPSNGTQGILQGNRDAMKRLISLAPKGQYGKTPIPEPEVDPATGEIVFKFPAHQTKDLKAEKAVELAKSVYAKNPDKKGGVLGFGGKPIPFEQSDKGKKIIAANPIYKEKKPLAEYRVNPSDPQAAVGQVNAMAAEQNIKLPSYNQILGQKGGHGQIPLSVPKTSKQIVDPSKVKDLPKLY